MIKTTPMYAALPVLLRPANDDATFVQLAVAFAACALAMAALTVIWFLRFSAAAQASAFCICLSVLSAALLRYKHAGPSCALFFVAILFNTYTSRSVREETYVVWKDAVYAFSAYGAGSILASACLPFVCTRFARTGSESTGDAVGEKEEDRERGPSPSPNREDEETDLPQEEKTARDEEEACTHEDEERGGEVGFEESNEREKKKSPRDRAAGRAKRSRDVRNLERTRALSRR